MPDTEVVVAAHDVMTADFSPDVVLLNLQDGVYYSVEDVGARVWTLLQTPIALGAILDAIATEFDVDRAQSDRDVRAFVQQLVDRGLAAVCGGVRGDAR